MQQLVGCESPWDAHEDDTSSPREREKRERDIRERDVYIYIHIYIYAVKLKAGPRFPFYKLKTGPFFCFFCFLFSKISFSLQKEDDF